MSNVFYFAHGNETIPLSYAQAGKSLRIRDYIKPQVLYNLYMDRLSILAMFAAAISRERWKLRQQVFYQGDISFMHDMSLLLPLIVAYIF